MLLPSQMVNVWQGAATCQTFTLMCRRTPLTRLDIDYNLSEMGIGSLMTESISQLGQRKMPVEHRLNLVNLNCGNHIQLLLAAADSQANNAQLLGHQHGRCHWSGKACKHTD